MKTDRSLYFSIAKKKKNCKIFISLPSIQELGDLARSYEKYMIGLITYLNACKLKTK